MAWMRDMSVRRKLFAGMLALSVLTVGCVMSVAVRNTYSAMREQLIYHRRMSAGWLQDRLRMVVDRDKELFYGFEVDKGLKEGIEVWCGDEGGMDYSSRLRLISAMNEVISMNSGINSMEVFNLHSGEALVAERSGASTVETGERLGEWEEREDGLQSNVVYLREGREILSAHTMHRFEDKQPLAVIQIHYRPYEIQDILEDIKVTKDESVLVFNDAGGLIEADYGELTPADAARAALVAGELLQDGEQELYRDGTFWFCREVDGKLRILLSVPDHVIFDSLKGTVFAGLMTALAAVAMSAGAAVLFSRYFSRPIVELAEKMRTFTLSGGDGGEGDEERRNNRRGSGRTDGEGRRDEVGVLQESFGVMVERNRRLIEREYKAKLDKREAQIHALQAQINPHFMYNIMQMIGAMALNKNAPEIYRVTSALGDLLRYCLNFSREMVPFREEYHYLQSYCMLQNERFGDRIKLESRIPDSLMDCLIPKLVLQPVLENSFHHGLADRDGEWRLVVEAEELPGELIRITVSDNGVGMTPERLSEVRAGLGDDAEKALRSGSHVGLGNVDARLRLDCPGRGCGVTVDSGRETGTTVSLTMRMERTGKGTGRCQGEDGYGEI